MENQLTDALLRSGNIYEIIIVLVILGIVAILRKQVLNYIKGVWTGLKFTVSFKEDVKKIKELKHHDIFRTISRVRRVCNKHRFHCNKEYDATKSQMFSDFMDFKLNAVRDNFKELIDKAPDAVDNDHLKDMCFDAVSNSISKYISETRVHFVKKGIAYKDADYVVDLFERWRSETVSSVQNRINSVFASKYHETKFQNLLAVLELISMAIDLIPKDGIAAFNSFNGKFKSVKYTSEKNR